MLRIAKSIITKLHSVIHGWCYLLAFITGGNFLRKASLAYCGKNVKIAPTAFFKSPGQIRIGDSSFINHLCCVWAARDGEITIGDDVLTGPGVCIISSNHGVRLGMPIREQNWIARPIRIGDDVWLGANVVVTAGVTIGSGCVVGANAVVTNDLPPQSICVGVPARVIGHRKDWVGSAASAVAVGQ